MQKVKNQEVTIPAPNFKTAEFAITGTAPLVMNAFPQKAKEMMRKKQEAGSKQNQKLKTREGKDFNLAYEQAKHVAKDGWCGIPCVAFRAAMVSACRTVGFKMTIAKLSIFIEPDGFDKNDGTPLVKITKGEPHYVEHMVRLETGVADIHPRPMWDEGWEATVRIKFDADMFSLEDISNLLMRVGMQVGLLEGRPDSKKSVGMGWGTFELKKK
jgi:hypothetical protein